MRKILTHTVTTHVAATLVGAFLVFAMLAAAMSQSFTVPLTMRPGYEALCFIVHK